MKNIVLASMLAVPALALAQVSPVGPFTGDHSDSFETTPSGVFQPSYDVFDTTALMISTGGSMHVTSGWGFMCSIFPFDGSRLAGSAGGFVRYEFTTDVASAFGGYFGTNADSSGPDATARFFDASGNQIGDAVIEIASDCAWTWNGWEFDSGVAAVEIEGAVFGGAFVMMDAMEVSYGAAVCVADCDGDGDLTLFDFLCFQNQFDAGDLAADLDGDGVLTLFDFLAFQNAFDAGCE
jgi:hypothetical protein